MCFAQLSMASGNTVNEPSKIIFLIVHVRKLFLNEFFFLLDSVKLPSLHEEESQEKELGHVTIQLCESDAR